MMNHSLEMSGSKREKGGKKGIIKNTKEKRVHVRMRARQSLKLTYLYVTKIILLNLINF